jgi:hypothetical protein
MHDRGAGLKGSTLAEVPGLTSGRGTAAAPLLVDPGRIAILARSFPQPFGDVHGFHGKGRVAVQASRVHFSVERDLRGPERLLDYGPLGVELKRNVKQAWWEDMVASHDETAMPSGAPTPYGMVGLDTSLL